MRVNVLACGCLVLVLCQASCSDGTLCPSGWTGKGDGWTGTCEPTDSYVASVKQSLASGVYGYARATSHGAPSGVTVGCDGVCWLVSDLAIDVYNSSDVTVSTDDRCSSSVNGSPVASTTSDSQGTFSMALPPGAYTLWTLDPTTPCMALESVSLTSEVPLAPAVFNFGYLID